HLGARGLSFAFARFGLAGHLHCVAKFLHPIPARKRESRGHGACSGSQQRGPRGASVAECPSGTEPKGPFYILHERRVRDGGQEIEGILRQSARNFSDCPTNRPAMATFAATAPAERETAFALLCPARPCAGIPVFVPQKEDVDGRDKPSHDVAAALMRQESCKNGITLAR